MSVAVEQLSDRRTDLGHAQEMTVWFNEYAETPSQHELGVIPPLAYARLVEQMGDEIGVPVSFGARRPYTIV